MKKITIILLILIFPVVINAQKKTKPGQSPDLIADKAFSLSPSMVKMEGYIGEKMDLCIVQRIKTQDPDYLVEPFRHKEETRLWQSEFWGKWIQSAIASYEYNNDPEMLAIIKKGIVGIIATQRADGYIGNYSDAAALQQWDIWGQKYTILGLLAYYDISKDKNSLDAAKKVADHLMTQVGPGKINIIKTGNYRGMPSSSILEPIVYLYRRTGEPKYLDFAKYIVEQWETPEGPKLISSALAGVPVALRFPHPASWWSYENGQKAYEMMSCYDGLLELYRITGEASYLKAVEMTAANIISDEINIAGSGSAFECWYNGAKYQTEPTYHTMETCVTMTWMKLCYNLLRITGNPLYADEIEKSAYNALLASMKYDGSEIAKYSPLGGMRHAGEQQCGMNINCCNANGPRAFMMLPRVAAMKASGQEILLNFFNDGTEIVPLGSGNNITLSQSGAYPVSGKIQISVDPEKPENFTVSLRIPSWSSITGISVNGNAITGITPGSYKQITRLWNKGDKIDLTLDMRGHLVLLNGKQAIIRGPVVLARDARFKDGFILETAVVNDKQGIVELSPVSDKPADIWMAFSAPLVLGTDLEGEFKNPRQVRFCDFASAGNLWSEESRYQVWIPRTLNVMKTEYKGY